MHIREAGEGPHRGDTMFFYIVRRLVSVVAMLFVISITTFLIFFACPNDPAPSPARRTARRRSSRATGQARASTSRSRCSTCNFLKGLFVERDFPDDPRAQGHPPQLINKCEAPCLGYSSVKTQGVTEIIKDALPITASLAIAAFVLWIVTGVLFGIIAALNRGQVAGPAPRRSGAHRLLAAELLHRRAAADLRRDQVAAGAATGLHAIDREPGPVGAGPGPARDRPRRRLRRQLRPADPGIHARDHVARTTSAPRAPRASRRRRSSAGTACAPP